MHSATLNLDAAKWMREIHHGAKQGRLLVASTEARREIFFDTGDIVGVRTSRDEERLGELLIRLGRITRQHFEDASIFVRHGWRLGEILAELRIIDRAEIDPFVQRQAIEVSCGALTDAAATVEFDERAELFTTLAAPLSATAAVMKASRGITNVDVLMRLLTRETRTLRPAPLSEIARCPDLTPEEGYLVSRFQDGATIVAVIEASGLEGAKSLGSLVGLTQSGLLVPENDGRATQADLARDAFREDAERMFRRLERYDPWRALALPKDVGVETAREAFRAAMCRYHPDRHHSSSDEALKAKLSRICQSFTDAYTCLSTAVRLRRASKPNESAIPLASTAVPHGPPTPTPPEVTARATPEAEQRHETARAESVCEEGPMASRPPAGKPPAAEPLGPIYLREGRRAFAAADYWRAIDLLRHAVNLGEDHFETHFLLAKALAKNPHWRHDAEQSYRRALELDPWRRDAYAGLARLYDDAGLSLRAERVRARASGMGLVIDAEPPSGLEASSAIESESESENASEFMSVGAEV